MPITWNTELTPTSATPVLSNLVAVANSTTAASATVDSNSATGTIYYVWSSSATRPSNATIKTGTVAGSILASGSASSADGTVNLGAKTGFTAGATIHIHTLLEVSSTQYAGPSATVNLPASAGNDFGTTLGIPTLTYSRTSGTAPMGVILKRTQTSSAARVQSGYERLDIETKWAYGNAGNFSALDLSPIWGTDRNVGYGFASGTIYDSAGTKSITLTSWDGESQLTTTFSNVITVNDPDTVFAGVGTAVVSATSDFANKPTNAAEFTTISAALTHLAGRQTMRLLLNSDETFGGISITESGGSNRRLYIGSYEGASAGARAKIVQSGTATGDAGIVINTGGKTSTNFVEVIIDALEIEGAGDSTANPPPVVRSAGIDLSGCAQNAHKTIWNCRIAGFAQQIFGDGSAQLEQGINNVYVGDCRIGDNYGWTDYGVFSSNASDWLITGTSIKLPAGTRQRRAKDYAYANHGAFRISRAGGTVIFANCDFLNMNDWAGSDVQTNGSVQPMIRWRTNELNDDPELVVDRFRGEGGFFRLFNSVLDDGASNAPGVNEPSWVLADKVFALQFDHPNEPVGVGLGGTTVRNLISVISDNKPWSTTGFQSNNNAFVSDSDSDNTSTAANWQRRSEVYSCAFIDLRRDAYAGNSALTNVNRPYSSPVVDLSSFALRYSGNNIEFSPNMVDGGTSSSAAPLNTTSRWTPQCTGQTFKTGSLDTDYAPPAASTASFKPTTGSPAIGAATGKVSLVDIEGNLRSTVLDGLTRQTPSVGPYEPDLES